MAHFHGTLQGNHGEATRCGTKDSGITTQAAGWGGCVSTFLMRSPTDKQDTYYIELEPWNGSGIRTDLLIGKVGKLPYTDSVLSLLRKCQDRDAQALGTVYVEAFKESEKEQEKE